jgi:hypothetical protein
MTTFASLRPMANPRMEAFQCGIDIRIDASDGIVDLDIAGLDMALRHARRSMCHAYWRLFGDRSPVVSRG